MNNSKELTRIFGLNLQCRRKRLHMTQEMLAERIGIGQQSLSRMERGGIAPKFERLQDIADALQCSVMELFNDPDLNYGEGRFAANHDALSCPASESFDGKRRFQTSLFMSHVEDLTSEEMEAVIRIVEEVSSVFKNNRAGKRQKIFL